MGRLYANQQHPVLSLVFTSIAHCKDEKKMYSRPTSQHRHAAAVAQEVKPGLLIERSWYDPWLLQSARRRVLDYDSEYQVPLMHAAPLE